MAQSCDLPRSCLCFCNASPRKLFGRCRRLIVVGRSSLLLLLFGRRRFPWSGSACSTGHFWYPCAKFSAVSVLIRHCGLPCLIIMAKLAECELPKSAGTPHGKWKMPSCVSARQAKNQGKEGFSAERRQRRQRRRLNDNHQRRQRQPTDDRPTTGRRPKGEPDAMKVSERVDTVHGLPAALSALGFFAGQGFLDGQVPPLRVLNVPLERVNSLCLWCFIDSHICFLFLQFCHCSSSRN